MRQVHNQVLTLAYCSGRSGSRMGEMITSRNLVHKKGSQGRGGSQLFARNQIKEATARGSGAATRASRVVAGGRLRRRRGRGGVSGRASLAVSLAAEP
ncbi:hypothetical protein F2Q68_00026764 [Brassica cretica]|uniref:Uncharacterized protein n=1 Tax=Brassica cretica TaxID=69181 RepID=A0A8S9I755_BRACR|nr:hypothetical protein F2Q68_00026764 [Brassica cretica]